MNCIRIMRCPSGSGWEAHRLSVQGDRPLSCGVSAFDCAAYVVKLQLTSDGEELAVQIAEPREFVRELFDRRANEAAFAMRSVATPC